MLKSTAKQKILKRIDINPKVLSGKPVIRGTRISIEQIMRMLAGGMTHVQIIKEFDHLTEEDIMAAIFYATELVQDFNVYPRQLVHQMKIPA
jgi:uncharacterized protein (DUF433 family)